MRTLLLSLVLAFSASSVTPAEDLEPGMLLPSGSFHGLDGKAQPVATLRAEARLTLIVFWATWSKSSLDQIERLRDLEPLCAQGLRVLLVNADGEVLTDEHKSYVEDIAAGFPKSFLVLRDEGLAMFREYGIFGIPTSFVADANGMVTFRLPGFPVAGGAKMLSYIENTLSGRPALAGPWAYQPKPRAVRYYHLSRILLRKGDMEMALHTLERTMKLDREYVAPLELMGDLEKSEGRWTEALSFYDEALRYNPDAPNVLASSGQCLAQMGELETGLARGKSAVEQDPGDGRSHARLALTLAIGERFEEARASLARAIELAPHDPVVFELQGQAYERMGMAEESIDAYWHAFDLIERASDPDLAVVPTTGALGNVGADR